MTDQELELELNEAGRASATPPARSTTCWGFSMYLLNLATRALNMACEILQLELGNLNLRLFGSPWKVLWTSAAHETDRLRQVIEKEMLKVEVKCAWIETYIFTDALRMGKLGNQSGEHFAVAIDGGGAVAISSSSSSNARRWRAVRDSLSWKCVLVLILSLGLFFSTIYWLPPFYRTRSGYDARFPHQLNVTAKASFMLQRPISLLIEHVGALEEDILGEVGMPNTKVSILSIHKLDTSNWTKVVFAVLPDPNDVPINYVSLSILRSSLIELFLGHIIDYYDRLKDQLTFGLQLRPYEIVYLQLTNRIGSTVDPPVIVQVSVMSDGNQDLLPQRLKQLAQAITRSPPSKNLGLDHSIFGKVKEITLSSFLNRALSGNSESPSPSPSPSPTQPPSPSEENYNAAPSSSPSSAPSPFSPPSDSPAPVIGSRVPSPSPSPSPSEPPAPSLSTADPHHENPCRGSAFLPKRTTFTPYPSDPELPTHAASSFPSLGSRSSPGFAPSPAVHLGSSSGKEMRSEKALVFPLAASSERLSPLSGSAYIAIKLMGFLWPLMLYLLCWAF
ncbi:hypothetical protein Syun_014342 [Stephania yunnanensis]|uniref:DUF7036 domain-containing protein n=1 Tax=Stephania yunnanensis TaxID=152371 RepID=A0AAP0JJC4_9MAGN